jgi:UDP-glucose 4-epimerase
VRALVTGGAGFLGSHVADCLLADGHEVAVLDDLSGGFRENVPVNARFYQCSILDTERVERIFAECKFDHVYHCAAYAAEGLSPFIRIHNYANNVVGSMCIINACVRHAVKCLVFTSSIAVYGAGQTPFTESTIPQPADPYGIAKYAVELDLAAAYAQFGLRYIIFRPHNVYGERQNLADPYRNVVGIFMRQLLRGEPLTIFGDGSQTRAFSYIADVAPIIARSPLDPAALNQTFNIGADTPYTVNDLAWAVQTAMHERATSIVHLPARHEVQHAFSSHERLRETFGAWPVTSLAEGLSRMATWAREHGVSLPTPLPTVELTESLPYSWRPLA